MFRNFDEMQWCIDNGRSLVCTPTDAIAMLAEVKLLRDTNAKLHETANEAIDLGRGYIEAYHDIIALCKLHMLRILTQDPTKWEGCDWHQILIRLEDALLPSEGQGGGKAMERQE